MSPTATETRTPTGKSPVARILRQVGGYAMLVAGVAGCVLPIIPGIPLLIGGLSLLSVDTPWAARLLETVKRRFRGRGKADASRPGNRGPQIVSDRD